MSQAYNDNPHRGGHEGIARLRFAPNRQLAEHIAGFYNASSRVALGESALQLYSVDVLPYQEGSPTHEPGRDDAAIRNFRAISQAETKLERRRATPFQLEDTAEFKRMKDDGGLDMRVKVIIDQLAAQALGDLANHFVKSGTIQVGVRIPHVNLEGGADLFNAHVRMVDALADRNASHLAVMSRGIVIEPRMTQD